MDVSIARRRFVVLRLERSPPRGLALPCGFQSPAGDSLSCDLDAVLVTAWPDGVVSIARRRFVVLRLGPVSYTHLRAHETVLDLVCRLLLEKKKRRLNCDVCSLDLKHILTHIITSD